MGPFEVKLILVCTTPIWYTRNAYLSGVQERTVAVYWSITLKMWPILAGKHPRATGLSGFPRPRPELSVRERPEVRPVCPWLDQTLCLLRRWSNSENTLSSNHGPRPKRCFFESAPACFSAELRMRQNGEFRNSGND